MLFDKLFQRDKGAETIKEQRQAETTSMILSQPNAQIDEAKMLERQEVLIQLTKWQQSRSDQMQKIFEKLSGYYYDSNKKALVPSAWDMPYSSLVGASKIVGFIEHLDHNVMLGNWSDKGICMQMKFGVAFPLTRFIRDNHRELGVSLEHAEYIFWNICNSVEANYQRGWNDGERRKDREMIKINEVKSLTQDKKKPSIFGINTG